MRDSFQHPAHTYTLTGVLIDSSNAGISKFSEKVDKQTRYDYFQRFGIGQGTVDRVPARSERPDPSRRGVGRADRRTTPRSVRA